MSVDKVRHESWEEYNNISKPAHYVCGITYEPKDVIWDWGLNFNLGNVVKYIARYGKKGDSAYKFIEDLKKARQYLTFEIEALEKEKIKSVEGKIGNIKESCSERGGHFIDLTMLTSGCLGCEFLGYNFEGDRYVCMSSQRMKNVNNQEEVENAKKNP